MHPAWGRDNAAVKRLMINGIGMSCARTACPAAALAVPCARLHMAEYVIYLGARLQAWAPPGWAIIRQK